MTKALHLSVAFALLTLPALAGDVAAAHELTFTRDILPIVQQNCVICHRPGGQNIAGMVAPFSLLNYEEARPWAKSIAEVVASKKMPPWYASPETKGVFRNERGLSDEQIATLVEWVRTGAKRGNPAIDDKIARLQTMRGRSVTAFKACSGKSKPKKAACTPIAGAFPRLAR